MTDTNVPASAPAIPTAPLWRRRWAVVKWTLVFLATAIAVCLAGLWFGAGDPAAWQDVLWPLLLTGGGIVGGYTGVATWQDVAVLKESQRR